MRTKLAMLHQTAGFERVLEALSQELIESTDEELLEAAKDLGMDPTMRGSAAFIGIEYPTISGMSDFFDVSMITPRRIGIERSSMAPPQSKRRSSGRKKSRKPPDRGSESDPE